MIKKIKEFMKIWDAEDLLLFTLAMILIIVGIGMSIKYGNDFYTTPYVKMKYIFNIID